MKELKALVVLKKIINIADYGRYMEEQEIIKEAIKELEAIKDIMLEKDEALEVERLLFKNKIEELNNRSCDGCKFGKFGVDSIGIEVECSLNWKCSRGYSDKFEAKGE